MENKPQFAFIIPAFNPAESLLSVVDELAGITAELIVIVDDGSATISQHIFNELERKTGDKIILLRHATNQGKGAALKTAFNYLLISNPQIQGVVTVDADGQHSPIDCYKIYQHLKAQHNTFILGCRNFTEDVPWRSLIGNKISIWIYRFLLGRKFKDTQTGLRGINKHLILNSLTITADRFNFETEQLAVASGLEQLGNLRIIEVPIRTIYLRKNKSSSFRPLLDSFSIYLTLLKYTVVNRFNMHRAK